MGDEADLMAEDDDTFIDPEDEPLVPSTRPSARARALTLITFVALYSTACALPAFYMQGQELMWRGVNLMVLGVMALRLGQFGWLANVFVAASLRCAMNGQRASVIKLTIIALGLGLHTVALLGQSIHIGHGDFNVVKVVAFGPGFYLWLACILFPLFASEWISFLHRRRNPVNADKLH